MQLVKRKDWQQIFPSHWQRTTNRRINDACLEIEAIYKLEFDTAHMFDKQGYSLFFKDLYLDKEKQVITCAEHSLPITKIAGGYTLGGIAVDNLDEFINIFQEQTSVELKWQDKVWKSLEELMMIIEETGHKVDVLQVK